jgi:hypothetical protein
MSGSSVEGGGPGDLAVGEEAVSRAGAWLDGNAAAGLLQELFVPEVTAALVTCEGCGQRSAVGALHAFTHPMGLVLRCPDCTAVLLRVALTPGRAWVELRGSRVLTFERGG